MSRPLIVVLSSVGILLAVVVLTRREGAAPWPAVEAPSALHDAPSAWVPFSAAARVTGPDAAVTRGRFYRDRHGSTRRETLSGDGSLALVDIVNVPEGRFYVRSATGRWSAQRMEPRPPASPLPMAEGVLEIVRGETVQGLKVVRERTGEGGVLLRARSLNGFALVEDHPDDGVRIEYSAIRLGEPDPRLFHPPEGARISELPWPHDGSRPR